MKRIHSSLITVVLLIISFPSAAMGASVTASPVRAAESTQLIITEFQTNGGSASQEFIELYNPTETAVVLDDATKPSDFWKIQFFSSSSVKTGMTNWDAPQTASNSIALSGRVEPHSYYIVSSTGFNPAGYAPDMYYSATSSHLMTDTGGGLQLLHVSGSPAVSTFHDRVTWLAQTSSSTLPDGVLASPGSAKSLQRQPYSDDSYFDINKVLAPFFEDEIITPGTTRQLPDADSEVPTDDPDKDAVPVVGSDSDLVAPLITEMLPNPGAPLTDAHDEFIELYNPNATTFSLSGYSLEVGSKTLHSYIFTADDILEPLEYRAYFAPVTGLSLTNSGGQARLRDRQHLVASQSDIYAAAADNMAWILADGIWQWTSAATPGAANIAVKVKTASPKAVAIVKKPVSKSVPAKTTTKKVSSKKTSTAKLKTKKTKKAAVKTVAVINETKPKPPIHPAILVAVGIAAVLYGVYEYRHDIAARIRKLTRHRADRRPPGQPAPGR